MLESIDPLTLAQRYHDAMPIRIREYLNHRGIIDDAIDLHLLGWNGERITIPIFDRDARLAFFKLAKDPLDRGQGPKMLVPGGTSAELYGWERLRGKPPRIVICEGEFDRLALESRGIAAVTSTGGAGVFRKEWTEDFLGIPEIYVCFDRDLAGTRGALRIARWLPQIRIVELPEEVGPGGDVTDLFVRLEWTRDNFLRLLEKSRPAPVDVSAAAPTRIASKAAGTCRRTLFAAREHRTQIPARAPKFCRPHNRGATTFLSPFFGTTNSRS